MRRRDFIAVLGGVPAVLSMKVRAQQAGDRVKRIGWLSTAQHPYLGPFRQALAAAGFVEGKDVEIVLTSGEAERMPLLAQSLAKDAIDVVVTSGAAASQAARRDITTKPVVFVTSDPVALGLVETLAHPGGNLTGFDPAFPEVATKWPEFMLELLPGARRFAVIGAGDQSARNQFEAISASAVRLGCEAFMVLADDLDFARHFDEIAKRGADAAMVTSTPTLEPGFARLIATANARRLPTLYQNRTWTEGGGLISYGTDLAAIFERAGLVVARILRGEHPANIPVERPTRFQLVINLKTAKALGMTIPPTLLARADEVIE